MFKVHRAIARALVTAPVRIVSKANVTRVPPIHPSITYQSRYFSHHRPRFTTESTKDASSQEIAATQESTDEVPEDSAPSAAPVESDDQATVALSEATAVEDQHTSQEIAATQESTDEVPQTSEPTAAPIQSDDHATAALSEATTLPSSDTNHSQPTRNPASLYVANLYFEVTSSDLRELFQSFGTITRNTIITDARGFSKGYGFITFENQADAERASRELNGTNFKGRSIVVQVQDRFRHKNNVGKSSDMVNRERASRQPLGNRPSSTLFIGNLSYQMSDRDLSDLFRDIKGVTDVRVAIDRRSGQPRGFSHADFIDTESASAARDLLMDKEVYGRRLRVDFSHPTTLQPQSK